MDGTEEQLGLGQALFRSVNERVKGLNEHFAALSGVLQIVCECGDTSCLQSVALSPSEYEDLRSDPKRFAVVPGHAVDEIEEVIAARPGYVVVQKRPGVPAALAESTDPRRAVRAPARA